MGIVFPPDYGYWNWIREPLCLKWQVLGFVPFIRYLPILFALTAGGMLQLFMWQIPFRQGLMVFISQIVLNVFAMFMLSLIFSFFLGMEEGATAASTSDRNNDRRPTATERRNRERASQRASQTISSAASDGLPGLQRRVRELGASKGFFASGIRNGWESINQIFEPGYAFFQPITRYLPLPVQDFLHAGGWLIAGPGLAAFGWYGWRNRSRRLNRRPRKV